MSLQVWLPLNGDLHNQGLSNVTVTNNGATVDNNGKIGKCYSFGTSTSYMTLPKEAMTSFTTECSITFWLKILNWNTSYATYFQAGLGSTPWASYIFGFLRNGTNSTICFTIGNGSSASNNQYLTSILNLNEWYHISLIYKTGKCQIYLNGILDHEYTTTIVPAFSSITTITLGVANNKTGYQTNCNMNDVRIYDHALSAKEVEEISKGLVLHYKLEGSCGGSNNLGMTSADYHNTIDGTTIPASGWGGDAGTVTFYHSGGYNNLPYKVYHKTAAGSGGIYNKTANDITIVAEKTYTMSVYIKSSRNFTDSAYNFNINRGADNYYINFGKNITWTTEWQKIEKTFTATTDQAGLYGEMSIVYNDDATDYYCYYSGFKIEEGDKATPWTPPINNTMLIEYDCSGYRNDGTRSTGLSTISSSPRYNGSTHFDGIDTHIKVPYNAVCPENIFTLNLWWKKDDLGTKSYETLFGGPSGFEMDTRAGAGTSLCLYMASTRGGTLYTGFQFGEWYMITLSRDGINEKYYVNGNLVKTTPAYAMPTGIYRIGAWSSDTSQNYCGEISDFRIYATALTETQIKRLYDTSATVDKNGNFYSREVVEE